MVWGRGTVQCSCAGRRRGKTSRGGYKVNAMSAPVRRSNSVPSDGKLRGNDTVEGGQTQCRPDRTIVGPAGRGGQGGHRDVHCVSVTVSLLQMAGVQQSA